MPHDFLEPVLQHGGEDWERVGVGHLALSEDVHKTQEVKIAPEVDFGNIVSKQYAQTDWPQSGHIPKFPQTVSHDCKSARSIGKFCGVGVSMCNKEAGKNFAAMDNNFDIVFGKEVEQPLQSLLAAMFLPKQKDCITLFVTVLANFLI